jgi:hypothetical protein
MKGFKTMAVAALLVLLGAVEQLGLVDLIPDEYKGLAIAVIGAVMAGLRVITTTPVLEKEQV